MSTEQKAQKNPAEQFHERVIAKYPMYQETAHWTPVLIPHERRNELALWFEERGLLRGDDKSRNDWLAPTGNLFLFKTASVAVEAKIRFGFVDDDS